MTFKPHVIDLALQWAVDTRRTHFEAAVFQALDFQQVLQLTRDLFAIFDRNETLHRHRLTFNRRFPRQIDRDLQQATARALQLHQVKTQSGDGLLYDLLPSHADGVCPGVCR
ncbi:hypothetical protein D9M69_579390 [compost metagenome]